MAYDPQKKLEELESRLDAAVRGKEKKPPVFKGTPPNGTPFTTTGPVGKSGNFSITRLLAARMGFIGDEMAKDDIEAHRLLCKSLDETGSRYSGLTHDKLTAKFILDSSFLPASVHEHDGFKVYKAMEKAGQAKYDPDEAAWIVRKADLSYLTDTLGGYTVPPPEQGEIIDLMRPQEAFMRAGATTIPLPPQGRMSFPRLTDASTAYWVGENTSITQSNQEFGQINLQAKKLGAFVIMPNELLKYSAVAVDGIVKKDMAKSLSLAYDYACFYGNGGATQPKGLTLFTDTNQLVDYAGLTPAPKGVAAAGNTLRPEDGYRMAGLIEDRNFDVDSFGWIMRPSMANNVLGYRADAASPADAAGGFVHALTRLMGDRIPSTSWCGMPVTKSAVVKNDYTKGSGTSLTEVFGGIWQHWMLAMYGVVELATSTEAGNAFQNDQTFVRALMHCDAAPRYEGAFIRFKELKNTVN